MTLRDALKLTRRWWWIIVAVPAVAALLAYLVTSSMTPLYRATATILVQQGQNPAAQTYQDLLAAQQQSSTYSRLITTRPVLSVAIGRLHLQTAPEDLARHVSAAAVQNTQLVTVSVSDPNPTQAADIANTVSAVFIEQNQAQRQSLTGSYASQLDQNIADVKGRIDDTSARIAGLQADTSSDDKSQLGTLQQQLSQYQSTYGSLLQARQQMAIATAQIDGQVRVAEQAVPPAHAVSPRKKLNVGLSGMLGLILAGGIVMLLGYLDDTVKSSADIEALTGHGALGGIPRVKTLQTTEALRNPRSPAAEGYRDLRTNLQFATAGGQIRALVTSSVRPGDGKTTTVTNLAVVLAQSGQRVILVDADLRKPRVHRQFARISNRLGLTNLLMGGSGQRPELRVVLQPTAVPNLLVLPSGPLPANPPDVLNAPRMRELLAELEDEADIVLIDAPPVAVSDPLILAGLVDGVLLVSWAGKTRRDELQAAVQRLSASGTRLLGVVLNGVDGKPQHAYYRAYYEERKKAQRRRPPVERPARERRRVAADTRRARPSSNV